MPRMISFLARSTLFGSFRAGASSSVRQASTLVITEHDGVSLTPSSLSAVEAARSLGENNSISILLAGPDSSALGIVAKQASTVHPSISQVLVAASEKLKHSLAEAWASLIFLAHQERNFSHIVVASSSFGKNVLPRAAALLNVSPVTDVTKIIDEQTFVRPIYAGNALSTVRYKSSAPCMLSVRPTAFSLNTSEPAKTTAPISSLDVRSLDSDPVINSSSWLEEVSQQSERPDLGNAKVVVSGGRALKSAENFKLLETLADKLGGAVGATRAAVDAGYVPNDLQVGQTGKIVAPELYIAIGVSGAIQHLAGMKDSKVIVAINKDADAPIFQVADYGLVGDLFEIIPEMLKKLPDKRLQ